MYKDVQYEEELQQYIKDKKNADNWLKAIDTNFKTSCANKLTKDSRERLLTLWTIKNTTLPYFNGKSYEI